MNQIEKLQTIYNNLLDKDEFTWLDGLNSSQAFLACIGAGPWKLARRQKIQEGALEILGQNDLLFVSNEIINYFPLQWQKNIVQNLTNNLKSTFNTFCNKLYSRKMLYNACGVSSKGVKVLSLFCRDYLKFDAFPIDRHVKRLLKDNKLPTTEDEMIYLCSLSGLFPNKVATAFVKQGGVQNPDLSKYKL